MLLLRKTELFICNGSVRMLSLEPKLVLKLLLLTVDTLLRYAILIHIVNNHDSRLLNNSHIEDSCLDSQQPGFKHKGTQLLEQLFKVLLYIMS